MNALRDKLEYLAVRALEIFLRRLPLRWSRVVGRGLGSFAFRVLRIRRNVTLENLRRAFPQKSEAEIVELARRTYRNFGITLAEFVRQPRLDAEFFRQNVQIENRQILDQVLREGRGGILVGGHFGNWEWQGSAFSAYGYKVFSIAAYQRNPLVDRLIDDIRTSLGMGVIKVGQASVREMLRTLRNNHFLAILCDQDAGRNGAFVRFFGRLASAPKGPATLHLKFRAPIIFTLPLRMEDGRYRIVLERIDAPPDAALSEENIQLLTQTLTSRLEQMIRRHPDQWFWMHRRWKSSHWARQQPHRVEAEVGSV